MMPGKAIIIVTRVCTEVVGMHRAELATLLLLCSLILKRYSQSASNMNLTKFQLKDV